MRLLLLVAVLLPSAAAQVFDSFADGDFLQDPPWSGDTARFVVVPRGADHALRLDGRTESDTVALATASDVVAGRWRFRFAWEGVNLSNFNGTRLYLVASTPALTGPVEGYYVQVGSNNDDRVRLYRQDGEPPDRDVLGVSDSALAVGDTGELLLEVVRDADGAWQVSVDGMPVIQARDATYGTSAALGVWAKHSASGSQAFFYDDVLADPTDVPDFTAPTPVSATVEAGGSEVVVRFDEPLDPASVTPAAFDVDGVGAPASAALLPGDPTAALLAFDPALPPSAEPYTLTVTGIRDVAGNTTQGATLAFTFEPDPDTEPPTLVEAEALDGTVVRVTFSEPVVNGDEAERYAFAPEIGVASAAPAAPGDATRFDLTLAVALADGAYTVTASGIRDAAGNTQPSTAVTFVFGEVAEPAPGDVVVNEVMYDPPGNFRNEWVELFNRTDAAFDLSLFRLADSADTVAVTTEPAALAPGGYVALVARADLFAEQFPGVPFLEVDRFPSLSNDGDAIVILSGETVLDSVFYRPSWGGEDASLERRDAAGPSNSAANWTTTTDARGGTPSAPNTAEPDTSPPTPVAAEPDALGTWVAVTFDEPLEPESVVPSAFAISGVGSPASVEYQPSPDPTVTLALDAPLASGTYTVTVTGVQDLLGNATLGAEVAFTFTRDETPPVLVSAVAVDASTVTVRFSEPLDPATAEDAANYGISGGIGAPASATLTELDVVQLALAAPLSEGVAYTLTVRGVTDAAGNALAEATAPLFFGDSGQPEPLDVVVNEIAFDPPTSGANEWVELYNRSDRAFDLSRFTLADESDEPTPLTEDAVFLAPGAYAVLVREPGLFAAQFPGVPFLAPDDFPNLNNASDAVVIAFDGARIDSVRYDDGWGGQDASLERIDPAGPSGLRANWATTADPRGGTPGAQNSAFAPDPAPLRLLFAEEVGAGVVDIYFNRPILPASLGLGDFAFSDGTQPDSLRLLPDGDAVRLFFGAFADGDLSVRGIQDYSGGTLLLDATPIARVPEPGQIVINEILFDPFSDDDPATPDGVEYVELYNAGDRTVTVSGWILAGPEGQAGELATPISIGRARTALAPGAYALAFAEPDLDWIPAERLADSSALALRYPDAELNAEGLVLLPVERASLSLSNAEDTIRLLRADSTQLDAVAYSDAWHRPELRDPAGTALERIDPLGPSSDGATWTSSLDPSGGTPGRANSVSRPAGEPPEAADLVIEPSPFDPDEGATELRYTLTADAALVRVRVFDAAGRLVRTLEDAALSGRSGSLRWDGRGDGNRELRVGIYVVLLEALDAQGGTTEAFKRAVVVARRTF